MAIAAPTSIAATPAPATSFVPRGANGSPDYSATIPGQTIAPVPSTAMPATKTSSTVLSNAPVIEDLIPALNARANTLAVDEPTTLSTDAPAAPSAPAAPNTDYASLLKGAYDSLPDITTDPTYQSDVALINSLKSTNDATANANINSIQKNYLDLTNTLNSQQQSKTDKEENALMLGGSARYAPISSGGIIDLKTRGDIQQLSTLQDQENVKIAAVKTAQANQDYQSMEKEISELDTLRTQKQTLAKSIADSMLKTNQTAATNQIQNAQDNAIAQLVKGGTTDPNDILSALTKAGYTTATAKAVTTTLESIQKATGAKSPQALSGAIGAFYSLKAAGQLPGDIASLPDSQQLFAFLKANKDATTISKAATTKAGATGKIVISGNLTYTPADFSADQAELNKSKGADGYVDPDKYQALATYWTKQGGNIADFLKAYPPKDYVNPANTTLPSYLRSSTKAAASATAAPFG